MKKRDLKNKITEAFSSETPDILSKIIDSCEKETQVTDFSAERVPSNAKHRNFNIILKRITLCAVCLMLFVSGLSVGLLIPEKDGPDTVGAAETFVYLDVNPSIELQMNGENTVIECIATNTDAEIILSDLKLRGVDMNTALTAIVGSMYVNGYLTESSNSILVSVDSENSNKAETLLTSITDKINTVFEKTELSCSIIAQSVKVDEALRQRAKDNGVSVGKMHLVDKMVSGMDDFDDVDAPELADMSIKELSLIYSTRPEKDNKEEQDDPFEKDVSVGNVGGFVAQADALASLLGVIGTDTENIEWYQVQAKPQRTDGSRQMVYSISIRFKNNAITYLFELDCQSGEVIKMDVSLPDFGIHGGGHPSSPSPEDEEHGSGGDNAHRKDG